MAVFPETGMAQNRHFTDDIIISLMNIPGWQHSASLDTTATEQPAWQLLQPVFCPDHGRDLTCMSGRIERGLVAS